MKGAHCAGEMIQRKVMLEEGKQIPVERKSKSSKVPRLSIDGAMSE